MRKNATVFNHGERGESRDFLDRINTDLTGKNHNNSVFLSKVEGAGIHFLIRYSLFDISYSNIVVKLSETH